MIVDDFIDELYAFSVINWADSLEKILHMLDFPLRLEYTCEWEEFLYEQSESLRHLSGEERKILAECKEITMFRLSGRFRKLKLIAVMLIGNPRIRNEKVYNIYRLFRKIYGRYVLFVACFDQDIAFVGTAVDMWKRSEVIISDWFGENTERKVMSRILEINFSLFSYDSLSKLYEDYLWAIARPYVKYRESKMYSIFECGYIETYESFEVDPVEERVIPVTKVDQEKTLQINSAYYPRLYGDDYFIDECALEDDILDILDEDDIEFEWTMLEMELAKEEIEDDDYDDDIEESYDEYAAESEEGYDEIFGMNPEEMLKYIHGK